MRTILTTVLFLLYILSSCDKYDLDRNNQHDPNSRNFIPDLPVVTTNGQTTITANSAVLGGNISADGGGSISARGVCWSTSENPTTNNEKTTDGTGSGSFTSNIAGLQQGTTYYVRAYATNKGGTSYGNQITFNTKIEDASGNTYNTVSIGTQIWMAENLKTIKYNDGTEIPHVDNTSTWYRLTTPGYCWYRNDEATFKETYGALYNWHAVDTRKLCPLNWHVPTDAEWTTLTDYLGGEPVAGSKMKETGNSHWAYENTGATNESGFTALPGGELTDAMSTPSSLWSRFRYNGEAGFWWTSNADPAAPFSSVVRSIYDMGNSVNRYIYNSKTNGASVRCIKGVGPSLPVLTTSSVSGISQKTATCGGNIISDGGDQIKGRGVCWSTAPNPTTSNNKTSDGTGTGSFVSTLTGLEPETTYHVRSYAYTISAGTAYGDEITFTTIAQVIPTITTSFATSVALTTATSGGNIISDGGAYIIQNGICWSTSPNPSINDYTTSDYSGSMTFTSNMSGLMANTTYFLRSYATNSVGTGYGNEISFTTYRYDAITDIDGNFYNIVTIGSQTWISENLKTTRLNDYTEILNATNRESWPGLSGPAYCWYDNDAIFNKNTYGALYNWLAVNTGRLCPTGWHVPNYSEWMTLETYLGGPDVAASKLKAIGTIEGGNGLWRSPNSDATNETGFNGLPGGGVSYIWDTGIGTDATFWSSTEHNADYVYEWSLFYSGSGFWPNTHEKHDGYSVRCLRDY